MLDELKLDEERELLELLEIKLLQLLDLETREQREGEDDDEDGLLILKQLHELLEESDCID